MFTRDRDLLMLEPTLFRDIGFLAQRLITGAADIAGTTLTLADHDVTFADAQIGAGHVVLIGSHPEAAPCEVLERISPTVLTISRLRPSTSAEAIPPAPATGAPVEIWTFEPQIALAHDQVMRLIGIDPHDPDSSPSPASIINIGDVRAIEALTALHLIYIAAAAPNPASAAQLFAKAEHYRRRATAARQQTQVLLDLTGNGQVESTRRFHIAHSTR